MKVHSAVRQLVSPVKRLARSVRGPSSWNGCGSLQRHRRAGLWLSGTCLSLSCLCACRSNVFGAIQLSLFGLAAAILTAVCWWIDRRVAIAVLGDSISAQECADLIVTEMREEGISFDEEQLVESVAAVLLQQSLDLAGYVDARVEHSQDGVFDVIGCAHRRSGERIEFMSRLYLWWSGGGQVHCDSLGLVWR